MSRAVKAGDRKAVLEALVARIARELEEAAPREVAPLTGRLLEVMELLDNLGGEKAATGDVKPEPTHQQKLADSAARKRGRAGD